MSEKLLKRLEKHSADYKGWLAVFKESPDSYPREFGTKLEMRLAHLQEQEAALALIGTEGWRGDAAAILDTASAKADEIAAHAAGVNALVDSIAGL